MPHVPQERGWAARRDEAILHGRQAGTQHYLGFAHDVATRVGEHRRGEGARLTQVLAERGITFTVARVWDGDRSLERQLRLAAHLSPVG